MTTPYQDKLCTQPINTLTEALESGRFIRMQRLLASLHPAETAHLLDSLPPKERQVCWPIIDAEHRGDVLSFVGEEVRASLIQNMNTADIVSATAELDADDVADILQSLPQHVTREVLRAMTTQHRRRVETVLAYGEDTAGGLMNTDVITVRADITLEMVLRYLRLLGKLPDSTDSLYVVNRDDDYIGALTLAQLVSHNRHLTVNEVMLQQTEAIDVNLTASEVAHRFEKYDLVSAPVIDRHNKLLGRITIDDVVDVIRDEAEHSMLSMAGLSEHEDTFAPVKQSIHRRALWLGVNLLTAFLAAWFIGLFDATIEKKVALAVLMPIVASMGGVAGSQTLTLVIRSIALGQLNLKNQLWLLRKEIYIGMSNGFIWASVIALVTFLWFDDALLGGLIGIAILINLIAAAISGVLIPIMLQKLGTDPALSGGVLLTTITDIVGFVAFLGFATLFII